MEIIWTQLRMAAFLEFILFVNILHITAARPSFRQEPVRKSALADGDVTFYCVVQDLVPSRHFVQWSRGGSYITKNTEILLQEGNPDADRIVVVADPSMGQYNLQISNVGISDDLTYFCGVYDQDLDEETLRSAQVRLEVHNVPKNDFPRCNPLEKPIYDEGTTITISCTSERANPPVLLQWYQGGAAINGPQLDDSQAGFRTLRYSFEARHLDDGAIFQCKMTTSAIESFERSCSLGPLQVNYRPRVALAPPAGPVAIGEEVRLECNDQSKPEPFSYRWASSIPLLDKEIIREKNNKVLVVVASRRLNGTKISCNATNIQGSSMSNQVVIHVHKRGYTTTEGSITERKDTPHKPDDQDPADGPDDPGHVSAPAPGLSSRLLLMIIGILSLMLIVLLLVLIFYTCRSYQTNGNHSIIYGAPSSICNGTNIDRAWDQTSVYFEPRDQISAGEAPTWLRTPRQPQWRRNVAVQVPFIEDPPYAEIEQDWDDKVYTLQI